MTVALTRNGVPTETSAKASANTERGAELRLRADGGVNLRRRPAVALLQSPNEHAPGRAYYCRAG